MSDDNSIPSVPEPAVIHLEAPAGSSLFNVVISDTCDPAQLFGAAGIIETVARQRLAAMMRQADTSTNGQRPVDIEIAQSIPGNLRN